MIAFCVCVCVCVGGGGGHFNLGTRYCKIVRLKVYALFARISIGVLEFKDFFFMFTL